MTIEVAPECVPDPWGLSRREREVLQLLLELDSNKAIATRLGVSHRTIEFQLHAARKKLDAQSRTMAAVIWDRWMRRVVA